MILYHGSPTRGFKSFEPKESSRSVLFSSYPVKTMGHFFAHSPEQAAEYGRHVAEVEFHPKKTFVDPAVDKHLGIDRLDPTRELHLAKIVAPMIKRDPEFGHYLEKGVRVWPIYAYSHPRNDSTHPFGFAYHGLDRDGLHWEVLDNPESVKRLHKLGYDSTYVQEPDQQHESSSLFVPHQESRRIHIRRWLPYS